MVDMEGEKGRWGFKALKQIVKLQCRYNMIDNILENYSLMLTYMKSAVTRNESEKAINSILDYVSNLDNHTLLHQLYEQTLSALDEARNERLLFKIGEIGIRREEIQSIGESTVHFHILFLRCFSLKNRFFVNLI